MQLAVLGRPGYGEKDSPLGSFGHAADEVLGKLLWGSALANDKTSEASFTAAVASIRQLEKWITDQQVKLRDWADGVDGAGSDFQGSAAGRLKEVLVGLRGEFDEVQIRLGGTGDLIAKQLETARDALHTAVLSLYDKGYNAWGVSPRTRGPASGYSSRNRRRTIPSRGAGRTPACGTRSPSASRS